MRPVYFIGDSIQNKWGGMKMTLPPMATQEGRRILKRQVAMQVNPLFSEALASMEPLFSMYGWSDNEFGLVWSTESSGASADGTKVRETWASLHKLPGPTLTSRLAQELGQLQPFIAVFPQECLGQLAYFGPT
jgi:hypothetical protein